MRTRRNHQHAQPITLNAKVQDTIQNNYGIGANILAGAHAQQGLAAYVTPLPVPARYLLIVR